jgi:hypothetical protein
MAVTQTGTNLDFPLASFANFGTVSSTITVPADAQLVLVGVSGYQGTTGGLEAMTFTKGGGDAAMVRVAAGVTDTAAKWQCALFFMTLPDTGSNKTLKWDWAGTGSSADDRFVFSLTFWKGVNTASPVRDSQGAQGNFNPSCFTPAVTVGSGDLVVAFSGFFKGAGSGTVSHWLGLTGLAAVLNQGSSNGAWATGSTFPTYIFNAGAVGTGGGNDFPSTSFRSIPQITGSATQVRVTFISGGGGLRVDHCSVGIRLGSSGSDTTTTPVEMLFSSASGFFLPSSKMAIVSDWTVLPAPVTATDRLVVINDCGLTPAFGQFWFPIGNSDLYAKGGAASWNSSTVTGFGFTAGEAAMAVIEALPAGAVPSSVSVGVLNSDGAEGAVAAVSLIPAGGPGGGGRQRMGLGLSVGFY